MDHASDLLNRARGVTSLSDFGDESFREGLDILVRSADGEARFNDVGRAAFDAQLVDVLSQRLQLQDWYTRHPEIDDEEVAAPLIGLGLPRTGSTALANMLGEDPSARSLRTWESMWPCPPPESETYESDPRIAKAEASMERRARLFPRMTAMLPSTATSPTECQLFMAQDFKSQLFQAFAHIPTYVDWLNHRADLRPTYEHLKRVLKLLQWRCPPKRWRLKNPSHSLFIDALDSVFPDARYWMTHRDVVSVVGSVSDVYLELSKAYSDHVDKRAIGSMTAEFCELGMRRMMAFRDAGSERRFFDIHFAQFQKDPFTCIAGLYEFLGEELTPVARARMQAWRERKPLDEQAYLRTGMGDFGFEPERVRERFRFYAERFRTPPV